VAENLVFQGGNCAPAPVVEFRNGSLESNHSRLTRCSISEYSPPDGTTDSKWVSLYGTYNRVDHCALTGKTNSGTTLVVWLTDHPNYHLIDSNYFGPRPNLGYNGGETIRVGTSDWSMYDSYTTVEYNLFDRCNGETEIISSKSCENVYRYNTFRSCQGTLTLRHGNRCTVEGNFFFGNGISNTGGIRIIGEDHRVINNYVAGTAGTGYRAALAMMNGVPNSPLNRYFQVKRALVAFNTFVDNRMTFAFGVGKDAELTLPPLDCTVGDNILLGSVSPFVTLTDTPINMTYQGNLYFGAALGIASTGFAQMDPRLAPAGSDGLRHLREDSPAIGSAAGSYPFVVTDMDGQVRDSLPDCGADEYSVAAVARRPLTTADVGPGAGTTDVATHSSDGTPDGPRLAANYPNPFNPATHIEFDVPRAGWATVSVFNLLGQEVATLFAADASPRHTYRLVFDATGLPAGLYFTRLAFGGRCATQPMMLVK
jgi:poly(beta-D-mannuronate) lyase